MPTTSWSVARPEISRPLGYVSFIASDITTGTVVQASLENRFDQNDYFIGWYVLIEDGGNAGAVRRVSDYVANGGTLNHIGVNLSATTTDATSSLHRFHPTVILDAYNRVRQDCFPTLYASQDYTALITGHRQNKYTLPTSVRGGPVQVFLGNRIGAKNVPENVLSNPDFEDWTSVDGVISLDDWAVSGSGASENQEAQTTNPDNYGVFDGENSLRLAVAVSTATTELQTVNLTASGKIAFEGMEVNFSVWVYTRLTSRVEAQISGTGVTGTTVTGTLHQGTGWEMLTVTALLDGTNNTFNVGVSVVTGAATSIYVDEAICTVGQTEVVGRSWGPLLNWEWIPPGSNSDGGTLHFDEPLPSHRTIRVLGRGLLSSVSADDDTFEIDGELLGPLYSKIREYLCREAAQGGPMDERLMWQTQADEFRDDYNIAINSGVRVGLPRNRLKVPDMA